MRKAILFTFISAALHILAPQAGPMMPLLYMASGALLIQAAKTFTEYEWMR